MSSGEAGLQELLAPIHDALRDPKTTEIVTQKPGEVAIEQGGKWFWKDVPEFTFDWLDSIGILAGNILSKPFDAAHPIVETTLPDGQRYTAIRPPITPKGTISVTIRKPQAHVSPLQPADFSTQGRRRDRSEEPSAANAELLRLYDAEDWPDFFALAVKVRKTIVATGQQFSGKSTFIRKLMLHLPPEDRVVTVEDTDEFLELPVGPDRAPLRNRVSLTYGSAGIGAEQLILTSLRMRADRVAIQELRGTEAYAFLRIHEAGQTGSFATWHAPPGDPFTPLSLMVRSHPTGRDIPKEELAAMLRSIVDIVAYCHRDPITTEYSTPHHVYFREADARRDPS